MKTSSNVGNKIYNATLNKIIAKETRFIDRISLHIRKHALKHYLPRNKQ